MGSQVIDVLKSDFANIVGIIPTAATHGNISPCACNFCWSALQNRRLFIIATSQTSIFNDLGFTNVFNSELFVPPNSSPRSVQESDFSSEDDSDVDLLDLTSLTKIFSDAESAKVVRNATVCVSHRWTTSNIRSLLVNRQDFLRALYTNTIREVTALFESQRWILWLFRFVYEFDMFGLFGVCMICCQHRITCIYHKATDIIYSQITCTMV